MHTPFNLLSTQPTIIKKLKDFQYNREEAIKETVDNQNWDLIGKEMQIKKK